MHDSKVVKISKWPLQHYIAVTLFVPWDVLRRNYSGTSLDLRPNYVLDSFFGPPLELLEYRRIYLSVVLWHHLFKIIWLSNANCFRCTSVVLKGREATFDGNPRLQEMSRAVHLQKLVSFLADKCRAATFGHRKGHFRQPFLHTTSVPGNCRVVVFVSGFLFSRGIGAPTFLPGSFFQTRGISEEQNNNKKSVNDDD